MRDERSCRSFLPQETFPSPAPLNFSLSLSLSLSVSVSLFVLPTSGGLPLLFVAALTEACLSENDKDGSMPRRD